jgi:hypothetical protein
MNDQQPSPGKSLITEIEKLREAVLLLCELQKQLAKKLDAVLMGSTSTVLECRGNGRLKQLPPCD